MIALASMAVSAVTAKAATVQNYSDGDIFLGVRATDSGTGSTSVYLVNLGNFSQFTTATASFEVANIFSDLNAIYGADNWYNRTGVRWGIVGGYANDDLTRTLYATRASSTAWASNRTFTALNTTFTQINNVRNSYNGNESTINNPDGIIQSSSYPNGYYTQVNGSSDFGSNSGWTGTGIEGALNQQLYFYSQTNGQTTLTLGTFSLSDQGVLTFNVNTVPEPSSALLLGLGGVAFMALRRRRNLQAAN